MKIKILLLVLFFLMPFNFINGGSLDLNKDSSKARVQNIDTSNFINKQTFLDIKNRIDIMEKNEPEITKLPNSLKLATLIVSSLSLLVVILFGVTGWISYIRMKEAKEIFNEFNKISTEKIESFDQDIFKFTEVYKEKIKTFDKDVSKFTEDYKERIKNFQENSSSKIDAFEKELSIYKNGIESKINEFDEQIKAQLSETDEKLIKFNEASDKIIDIEKTVSNSQAYIYQGIKSLFDFLYKYVNAKSEKQFLEIIFIQKAICNLYSINEKDRFTGITALLGTGTLNEIKFIEKILENPDETPINKKLATDAIVAIKIRNKKE